MMEPEKPATPPLRVLFVSHWFPRHEADWGGIFVLEQAQALRAAGVDVRVVVGEPMASIAWRQPQSIVRGLRDFARLQPPQWQDFRGVPVVYVPFLTPHPRLWGALAPRSYILSLMRWHKQLLANFTPQIIHAHTAFLDGSAASWLSRQLKARFVLTEGTGPFATQTRTPAQKRLTQAAVNAADVLVPVSQFQLNAIKAAIDLSKEVTVRVIGNCFDPEVFKPTALLPALAKRFLWIGPLNDNKQPLMVLDAFALAVQKQHELRMTLIGNGPLAAAVLARITSGDLAGKVDLLPPQGRASIAGAMRDHGALIIASRVETFGVVAVEAMGSGRPVLATRCGGPEEIIAATGGGLVVDNTAQALAKGMIQIAEGALAGSLAHDPFVLASAAARHFGAAAIAQALIETYATAMGRESKL
jgi:glycosyltransferase involved in cell wall biosynthesis